jgi:hypothetical protein
LITGDIEWRKSVPLFVGVLSKEIKKGKDIKSFQKIEG